MHAEAAQPVLGPEFPTTFKQLLALPEMTARLGAWGMDKGEVEHLLGVLSASQRDRLRANWQLLSRDVERGAALDASAMYLTLVTRMRDSALIQMVISNR